MISKFNYLIFVLFNHFYKDGNYKKDQTPYISAVLLIMIYQLIFLLLLYGLMEIYCNISFLKSLLQQGTYIAGLASFIFLFPLNYLYFIKKGKLDYLYEKYTNSKINTKSNRRFAGIVLILLFLVFPIIIGNLKHVL
jgi:hypothetical protein